MSYFLLAVGLFLASMASLSGGPIVLGGFLISLSLVSAMLMGVTSSSWYAYILFLVFVGGVLVLFTYVCMVSSNFVVSNLFAQVAVSLLLAQLVLVMSVAPQESSQLGHSTSAMGDEVSLAMLLGLVVLLLVAFLTIVRVITCGGSLQIEPTK